MPTSPMSKSSSKDHDRHAIARDLDAHVVRVDVEQHDFLEVLVVLGGREDLLGARRNARVR